MTHETIEDGLMQFMSDKQQVRETIRDEINKLLSKYPMIKDISVVIESREQRGENTHYRNVHVEVAL